jgi:hypothetical protein
VNNTRLNQLKQRNSLRYKIAALDRVIEEVSTAGNASATLSAGGGSQSYTYADLEKLQALRGRYASRLDQINMALAAFPNATGIRHVLTVRSGGVW